MYITDGCNIIVPRGDRADIPFVFTDEESGDPYVFDEGTQIRLDVFPVRGADSVISETLEAPGAFSASLRRKRISRSASISIPSPPKTGPRWTHLPDPRSPRVSR